MRLFRSAYRELSSTHLTLVLLILLIACMLLGTIFPQGGSPDEYALAFGEARARWFTRLGLFDIFHSWYFLLLGGIFFLNIVFCSIEGWKSHRRPKAAAFKEASTAQWEVSKGGSSALIAALKERRYRVRKIGGSESASSFIAQRGLPSRPVSIIYHFGLALTFVGFVLSALTAFDGEVYLFPGETKKIPKSSPEMTVNRWKRKLGLSVGEPDSLLLRLESFRTEYTWYNMKYYPKEWKSEVVLTTHSGAKKKVIEVNAPLRYRGLTIYQMSYKQEFEVASGDSVVHVESGTPFEIPGINGRFSIRTVRTGTLFKKGKREEITPHADLYFKEENAKKSKRMGRLTVDTKFYFRNVPLTMRNFREASGLYFRRDDGVFFLYVAFLLFMVGLFTRIFWPSYRISLHVDEEEGKAYLSAKVAGIAAYQERELGDIHEQFLGGNYEGANIS
jgi:cytochrome c biogenesis protein